MSVGARRAPLLLRIAWPLPPLFSRIEELGLMGEECMWLWSSGGGDEMEGTAQRALEGGAWEDRVAQLV